MQFSVSHQAAKLDMRQNSCKMSVNRLIKQSLSIEVIVKGHNSPFMKCAASL